VDNWDLDGSLDLGMRRVQLIMSLEMVYTLGSGWKLRGHHEVT
jgi:hypothetical protein